MLASLVPATVYADRVSRFSDHTVDAFCEQPIDGGYFTGSLSTSTAFGSRAEAAVWFDPAIAFEEPASASGTTETIDLAEGATEVVLSATFHVFDANEADLGEAHFVATMTPAGDPQPIESTPQRTNHHSTTDGTLQSLEGSATLSYPGVELAIACFGEIVDVDVVETNPTSFVFSQSFMFASCFWETEGAVAGLSVFRDDSGVSADAFLDTPDLDLFTTGSTGSIDTRSMAMNADLEDASTGDAYSASAAATLAPLGDPVSVIFTSQGVREKRVAQLFSPDGSLQFSTGDAFTIDVEHCSAETFSRHLIVRSASGPKTGPVPVNDTPSGAIELQSGSRLNQQTTGTARDAEAPISTCPEGTAFGHTVWYTVEGTGGDLTFDTAGTNFDTVVAAYTRDGDSFTEVACVDDVALDFGRTLQASITVGTELGVTYWIQVGGFLDLDPQFGRLRVAVD